MFFPETSSVYVKGEDYEYRDKKTSRVSRILRETELGSNKRLTRMTQLIDRTREEMKAKWFDKRVKVTSTVRNKEGRVRSSWRHVREGVVIEVNVVRHSGLMTTFQVKLDEGGLVLCAARHADLL